MIPRPDPIDQIEVSFQVHPVTALLGPRQCGKTTLARLIAERESATFFDLENPVDIRRLSAPMLALQDLTGLVIIDEVQRKPELFELLRVLVDRSAQAARFLILGSASPHLVKGAAESLAGRIGFVDLAGFHLWETGWRDRDGYGYGAVCPGPFLPIRIPVASNGARTISVHFLKETSPNSVLRSRRKPSVGSGRWSPITMARYGMGRNLRDRSEQPRIRPGGISISCQVPTWCGCCPPGSRT